MAIRLEDIYVGKVNTGVAGYPDGQPRNVVTQGDGTGTPYEAQWQADIAGFFQKLLSDAGIVASGVPDTTLASDYVDSLNAIYSSLSFGTWEGLLETRDSGDLLTTAAGRIRNQANTVDLILAAPLQKDIKLTWAEGAGLGGLADTVAVVVNTWYRKFIAVKADFSAATIFWDSDVAGANFFASAVAIAAGYTNVALYRRCSWTFLDFNPDIPPVSNGAHDPMYHLWDGGIATSTGSPAFGGAARNSPITPVQGAPNCLVEALFNVDGDVIVPVVTYYFKITSDAQPDVAPAFNYATLASEAVAAGDKSVRPQVVGRWKLDASSNLFWRSSGAATVTGLITPFGWVDNLQVP